MSDWTAGVIRRVLPNGLTLLVQRDSSARVVAAVTHVKAGYFDEPDEWVGISHVLEHMFFKGTNRRRPGDLARETQLLGGYLNASTIYDKTVYYTVVPSASNALELAIDLQSDALMNAALDQGELSRELEVVIQEAKRKLDNPPAVANETLYHLLFRVHRMRRWRIGTEEGLRKLNAEALRQYYRSRYTPARTIVGLVGDLDPDAALELATRAYGDWNVTAPDFGGSPPEPDGQSPVLKILTGDIERSLGVVGWRTTSELHADTPALDVAASILGSGRGSWLSRFVRTPGIAASVGASHYTPNEVGVFELSFQSDEARFEPAVERALTLVRNLADEGPDEAELTRVRSLSRMSWARAFETMDGRAASLCDFEALGGFALADEVFDQSQTVTAGDVRRVAATYLDPEQASAVFYHPPSATPRSGGNGGWPRHVAPVSMGVQSPAIPELKDGKASISRERQHHADVLHVALQGIDLVVQSKKGTGLASVGLFIPGARDEEDETNAGISALFARVALRGAAGMTAEELALTAESMGGAIGSVSGFPAVGWSISVPVDQLANAARLLRSVALEPTLDPEQVRIERDLQAADAARVRDDMYRYPLQRVLGLAYPSDPYGLPPLGVPERVQQMDERLLASWKATLGSRRAVAIAVGDLAPERLVEEMTYLGDWSGERSAKRVAVPRFHSTRTVEQREKKQSALAMAFPGAASNTPRRFAVEVLCDFLSGLAGRLFHVLREERALAYTVMTSPWAQRRAGAVLTYIATSPDRENEARDAMLEALAEVVAGKVSEAEVERARNYAAGLVEIARQTTGSITGEILRAWTNGLIDDLPSLPENLRSVTVEEVVREAGEVFDPETRAEFVVRGKVG